MRSLFIHDPADLHAAIPGGVQLCSREFLEIVRAASSQVSLLPVTVTRAPCWRLRRRLGLGSYLLYRPEDIRGQLAAAIQAQQLTHIFINRTELSRLASLAAQLAPTARIVLMSHGNQSGDDLYEAAGPGGGRNRGLARFAAIGKLGYDLVTESHFRHGPVHAVCVMSAEEAVLERWLGARKTIVLPRIIHPRPIDWRPITGRMGFVGTLDHTPNRVALERLCALLQNRGSDAIELRVAGGPIEVGEALAVKFPFVTYIGRPDDECLRSEVASWTLFLNPIFWLSRGASMKLGQSLAWAIPALTTRAGARGYRLEPGDVFVTDDEENSFVDAMLALNRAPGQVHALRERIVQSKPEWPDTAALARELKSQLT
jgi:hypothetical protein